MHDPDALLNIIHQQRPDQAMIEANDTARRQTATWRDARSVAAAGTKLQGNAADKPDGSQSAKIAGLKAERNRRYENNECFVWASKVTSIRTAPKASRARRGKAFMARATARTPSSSSISSSSNPQRSRSAYPEQSYRDGPCVCHLYGWS